MLENISLVLQYFIPGFLFLSVFTFFRCVKMEEYRVILWSVVISYIIVVMLHLIPNIVEGWGFLALSIVAGLLLGLCAAKGIDNPKVREKLIFLGKTPNANIWKDVIDFDLGTAVIVSLKDSDQKIAGTIELIEETNEAPWIILRDFQVGEVMPDNEPYLTRLALNLQNIDYMELYYQPDTKRILH